MAKAELSVLLDTLSGKAGNSVFYQSRGRQMVRARVIPRQPNSPAQLAARSWVATASVAYRGLSPDRVAEWQQFAHCQLPACTANTAFIKLASKFQQIQTYLSTDLAIPLSPPIAAFPGDSLTVTVTPVIGGLQVTASQPNLPDTATEILVQLLPSPNRKPRPKNYKTATIFVFGTNLDEFVPLPPGPYALAYRFVRPSTGEQKAHTLLPSQKVCSAVSE